MRKTFLLTAGIWFFTANLSFAYQEKDKIDYSHKLGELKVTVLDVFDSTEAFYSFKLSRLVNFFHIKSHPSVINRELLFLADSVLTPLRVSESENNLRSTGIFQWVEITSGDHEANGDGNDTHRVNVVVKDHFTTAINSSLSFEGGEIRSSFGIEDNNLLGRGYVLDANISHKQNRDFARLLFKNPRSFGTRFESFIDFLDFDTADFIALGANKRFYSQEQKWDMGVNFLRFNGEQNLYSSRNNYLSMRNNIKSFQSSFGKYFGENVRYRVGTGFTYKNEKWINPFNSGIREHWNARSAGLSFGGIKRNLETKSNVDFSQITEDVATGFLYKASAGYDFESLGATADRVLLNARAMYVKRVTDDENILFEADHGRVLQNGEDYLKESFFRVSGFTQRIPGNTLGFKVDLNMVDSPRPFTRLYLGEDSGLRGYSILEFNGDKRILVNVENRFFSKFNLFFVNFGGVLFFDAGKVWNNGEAFSDAAWRSSAGFGLRLGIPKLSKGVVRLDFAYNFDRKEFSTVSFSSNSYFRFLYPMELGVPNFFRSLIN